MKLSYREARSWLAEKINPDSKSSIERMIREELTAVRSFFKSKYFSHLENPDKILKNKMSSESYTGYDRMIDQDCHLSSCLQTRKLAITGLEWGILPYKTPGAKEANSKDAQIAEEIKWILKDMDDFKSILGNILLAFDHGFSVGEIMFDKWRNWIVINEVKSRYPGNFRFGDNNQLQFSDNEYSNFKDIPEEKMIVYNFNRKYDNRYGTSLCKKAYYPHWFKTTMIRYMMLFSERLGMPSIVGKYPRNWSEEDRNKFYEDLKTMQKGSAFAIPDDALIEIIETKSRSEGKFIEAVNFFNDEESKLTIGQTLTSGEGRRSGSLALGEVHNQVRMDILESDVGDVENIAKNQIIKRLVHYNFGTQYMAPTFKLMSGESTDLNKDAGTVKILVEAGLPLAQQEMYDHFGFRPPEEGEPILEIKKEPNPFMLAEPIKKNISIGINKPGKNLYDIATVNSVYDDLYKFLAGVYAGVENQLLISLSPGTPLRGLIDQVVRQYFNRNFINYFADQAGIVADTIARNLAEKFKQTLSESSFEQIKNDYIRNRFYEKGTLDKVGETMRNHFNNVLPDWTDAKFDLREMRAAIKSRFKEFKDWKIDQIARNEISNSAHESAFSLIDKTGLASKLDAYFFVDPQSCDICQEWAANNPYTVEQARSMGLPHIQCNDQWTFAIAEKTQVGDAAIAVLPIAAADYTIKWKRAA